VDRSLFVPRVDDGDAMACERLEYRFQMRAVQSEDVSHVRREQRADHQFSA